ncbi:hypothetical protein [Parasitella parasitica]|uniref:Uncharacterized protein n=1 Tax=Parasitella parasitica TaxID=35722 RepID=A0A0B7MUM8_9FUNG|nr:hypothetical protein [Parasitella parasitica]
MCNNLDQEIKLKDFWISEVCKLKEECRGVKIIEDIHMIDFGKFELKSHMHFRKRKTPGSVADQYADKIDELFNPVSPNSFSQAEAPSFKALLKLKKADARKQDPSKQKVLTKRLIKMMKTFCENADEFKNYNETEYTFYFLVQTNDESRAAVGSKIDIIISHKIFGVEIGVVEVSGPSHKVDKTHFLGDRAKIAKNLKSIHKQLERSATTPNLAALKRLKLYGIQVYLNKIIIYSLTRVSSSFWVFLCEQRIDIPSTSALFQNQLPAFFGYLWSLNENLKEVDCHFKEFLKQSNEEHILSSDSEIASPEVSQEKNRKQKLSCTVFI